MLDPATGRPYTCEVIYEWHRTKASENRRKHGVDFHDAIPALEDPDRLEETDDRHAYDEQRTMVIGMALKSRVLFVVTTSRSEDTCRIISARKATRNEQDRYYAGDREAW